MVSTRLQRPKGAWCMEVDINDLPLHSPWPERLLGLSDWHGVGARDTAKVLDEYGQKWGNVRKAFDEGSFGSLSEAINGLFGIYFPDHLLFHYGEHIYRGSNVPEFWQYVYAQIHQVLAPYLNSGTKLVELGCGWGRNLFVAATNGWAGRYFGGEFTKEGVTLATQIAERFETPAAFGHFDYYNPSGEILAQCRDAVVFTHNSIEQIPIVPKETAEQLAQARPRVVVHFEPVYEYRNRDSLLHCMWRRYTQMNNYNTNLLTLLEELAAEGRIEIVLELAHALGLNAFNPGSFIVWKPAC